MFVATGKVDFSRLLSMISNNEKFFVDALKFTEYNYVLQDDILINGIYNVTLIRF